jgi:hypothetical protein
LRLRVPPPGLAYSARAVLEKSQLVRTWRLTSSTRVGEDGTVSWPWGESPIGFVTYTPDWMSLHILSANRVPLNSAEDSYVSYAGTYAVVRETVLHHIHASSRPEWLGTTLVRRAELDGDTLRLSTVSGGPMWINEWTALSPG